MATWVFFLFLTIISVFDFYTKTIHDSVLVCAVCLCYPLLIILDQREISSIVYGVIWGLGSYGMIFLITGVLYRREVFGMGDVLFNGFISGFLGLVPAMVSSVLTFFIATFFIFIQWIWKRNIDWSMELPLAPSMAVSAVISLFFYRELLSYILAM